MEKGKTPNQTRTEVQKRIEEGKSNRFRKGSGCFTCSACGKKTRDTGENGKLELCKKCMLEAEEENREEDEEEEKEESTTEEKCTNCGKVLEKGYSPYCRECVRKMTKDKIKSAEEEEEEEEERKDYTEEEKREEYEQKIKQLKKEGLIDEEEVEDGFLSHKTVERVTGKKLRGLSTEGSKKEGKNGRRNL